MFFSKCIAGGHNKYFMASIIGLMLNYVLVSGCVFYTHLSKSRTIKAKRMHEAELDRLRKANKTD